MRLNEFVPLVSHRGLIASLLILTLAALATASEPPTAEQQRFFESEVRPLLAEKCYRCHGPEKQNGGLRLDSLRAMLDGGESGPSILPGNPDESLLVEAVRYESLEMPPSKPLSANEVSLLTKWVAMGAPWPGSDPNAKPIKNRETFSEEDRAWWAIQPVVNPNVPQVENASWPRNPVDNFILDRMTLLGLVPAGQANSSSLVRRLYLDVVGLPPTPEQVDAFVQDSSIGAYERLVDQLLDSPGFGENTARQWLDLVRYADSDGYRADAFRPDAWRYRDYVIKSFNDDKPYDRFVQEQIAGDEMFPNDRDAQVALGYLRHWVYEWNIRDAPGQWNTILDDVTDTTADVFMGLGLQCAKCHDHKFDPLLRKDYFRLRAFFAPIMPKSATIATTEEIQDYLSTLSRWKERTAKFQQEIDSIEAPHREKLRNTAINRFPSEIQEIVRKPAEEKSPLELQFTHLVQLQIEAEYKGLEGELKAAEKDHVLELRRKIDAFASERPADLPMAMAVSDVGEIAPNTEIPKRAGDRIDPGFLSILSAEAAEIPKLPERANTTGRRSALAQWLTRPDNQLATRVIVNRIWQSHFGRGLAANTSDFGRLGEPPTHPELLDWLTGEFIKGGWSMKSIHRLILNSATYRQATSHELLSKLQSIDPANRFYWRSDTRRLPAEKIRDAILFVTGQLDDRHGGPGMTPDVPCRTIFTRVMRNSSDELLESFDLPLFFSSNSSRNTTTTPVQSLLLINSDMMLSHARKLSQLTLANSNKVQNQIAFAWRRVYGRHPSHSERQRSLEFIEMQTQLISRLNAEQETQFVETAKLPYRNGQAIRFVSEKPELELSIPHSPAMNVEDFTLETFFQLRSSDDGSAVRTLLGKWSGDIKQTGWGFGVTGQGSRRKPQTLVLQLVGKLSNGMTAEQAIFSDQHIELNKPYYVGASVRLSKPEAPGTVTFYLKDLSNDDEPLLTAVKEHDVIGGFENELPLRIGGLRSSRPRPFDGLIDDVRFVGQALTVDQLLYSSERMVPSTVGHWQFESEPGVTRNSVQHMPDIEAKGRSIIRLKPTEAAMVDFCHSLLNSNGFLYVD